jgi:hypothetical protein
VLLPPPPPPGAEVAAAAAAAALPPVCPHTPRSRLATLRDKYGARFPRYVVVNAEGAEGDFDTDGDEVAGIVGRAMQPITTRVVVMGIRLAAVDVVALLQTVAEAMAPGKSSLEVLHLVDCGLGSPDTMVALGAGLGRLPRPIKLLCLTGNAITLPGLKIMFKALQGTRGSLRFTEERPVDRLVLDDQKWPEGSGGFLATAVGPCTVRLTDTKFVVPPHWSMRGCRMTRDTCGVLGAALRDCGLATFDLRQNPALAQSRCPVSNRALSAALNAIGKHQTYMESFRVDAADGSMHGVTINNPKPRMW